MEEKKGFMQRMQERWGLSGPFQVIMIFVVFGFTGPSVLFIKKPLFDLLNISETEPAWVQTLLYLILIFPLYQILLLFYGFIFGQFRFFWEKEKKLVRLIARPFRRKEA